MRQLVAMSNPVKRKNSANYYFLKAVPEDLVAIVGKTVIKKSLRTTDPVTAAVRNEELDILWTGNFAALRGGIIPLNHRQRVALAGVLYRTYVGLFRDEPGEAWQVAARLLADALTAGDPDTKVLVGGKREVTDRLLQHYKDRHRRTLTEFLIAEGLQLSVDNFEATLSAVDHAMYQASLRILRFHRGDYAPDPANLYPIWEKPMPRDREGKPIIPDKYDLLAIYDTYASQQEHAPKTIAKFRPILEQVAKEHPDVRTITREWCIEWKNQLLGRGHRRAPSKTPISVSSIRYALKRMAICVSKLTQRPRSDFRYASRSWHELCPAIATARRPSCCPRLTERCQRSYPKTKSGRGGGSLGYAVTPERASENWHNCAVRTLSRMPAFGSLSSRRLPGRSSIGNRAGCLCIRT